MCVEGFVDGKSSFKTPVSSKSWAPTWEHFTAAITNPYSRFRFKIWQIAKFGPNHLLGEAGFSVYPLLQSNNGKRKFVSLIIALSCPMFPNTSAI